MHWMIAHIYVTSLVIATLLLIGGTAIVSTRAPVGESDSQASWGGAGGIAFLDAIGARSNSSVRVPTQQLISEQARDHTPITLLPTDGREIPANNADVEWEALLTQLVRPAKETGATEADGTPSLYSFIPSGLISTSGGSIQRRTAAQDALYEYGNSVGSYIIGFDDLHSNMIHVLKDAYEDRGDEQKVGLAKQIGADYIQLGKDLELMDTVPKVANAAHMALAKAYQTTGKNMIAKLETANDDEFIAAVNTYNASVEDFTKRFIALVTIFEVAEVKFSSDDPGKVFMFQASAPTY